FDDFLPIADRKTKLAKAARHERAIFKLFSLGIVTNRDDWAYDDDPRLLKKKISLFCERVAEERNRWEKAGRPKDTANFVDRTIKWTSELEAHLRRGTTLIFDSKHIVSSLYRPFVKRFTYFAPLITHRPYQNFSLFPDAQHTNVGFSFGFEKRADFGVIAVSALPNKDMFIPSAAQVLARYSYSEGKRLDNVTEWALEQFRAHYEGPPSPLAGEDVPAP